MHAAMHAYGRSSLLLPVHSDQKTWAACMQTNALQYAVQAEAAAAEMPHQDSEDGERDMQATHSAVSSIY